MEWYLQVIKKYTMFTGRTGHGMRGLCIKGKQPLTNRVCKSLLLICTLGLVQGCSTMNKSECLYADWQLIGQADASKGVHAAVLDEYRSDCAEYAVVPDREAYQRGYQAGLKQFCTRANGFYLGKNGSKYQGICPVGLASEFLQGYQPGYALSVINDAITTLRRDVSSAKQHIRKARTLITQKEQKLISEGGTRAERKRLLREIKVHRREIYQLKRDGKDASVRLSYKESEYDSKLRAYTY